MGQEHTQSEDVYKPTKETGISSSDFQKHWDTGSHSAENLPSISYVFYLHSTHINTKGRERNEKEIIPSIHQWFIKETKQ